jgi:hypothetical protein
MRKLFIFCLLLTVPFVLTAMGKDHNTDTQPPQIFLGLDEFGPNYLPLGDESEPDFFLSADNIRDISLSRLQQIKHPLVMFARDEEVNLFIRHMEQAKKDLISGFYKIIDGKIAVYENPSLSTHVGARESCLAFWAKAFPRQQ